MISSTARRIIRRAMGLGLLVGAGSVSAVPAAPAVAASAPPAAAAVASGVLVAPASRPGDGAARAWHGMMIQSLDPASPRGWAALAPRRLLGPLATLPANKRFSPWSAPPRDRVLSNERTITRWAYTAQRAPIRTLPRPHAHLISRLRWYDEDNFPEIYLLLRLHTDATGQQWIKLRIPMRPNDRVGWVRRQALGSFHINRNLLVVNRERLRMQFFANGRLRWSAPVGVGKPSTPTPAGRFWIRERFKILSPASGYWPYAFGTTDYSTLTDWPGGGVIGIHGPYYQPDAIPGRPSHGCIRLRVANDQWLAKHLSLGTPLRIR